ncbi:MAG TPA: alpha-amylase family glycosyl hydrolase, partial [Trueperaceae bacterium]|nr:alpha-amylase family glycosyl hydrolase [Trueperaceae bacterium]
PTAGPAGVGATDDGAEAAPATAARDGTNLLDLLTAPQRRHPDSLFDQLQAALELWGAALGERYAWLLERALRGLDVLREERPGRVHGSGPPPRPSGHGAHDPEARAEYSVDREWMPRVAMVAKNAFVWLEQLSAQHGRLVTRLDEVPDATLDDIAADGFNALWLVGVWQRSEASKTIKRLRGQPFAEASAYAIAEYVVAPELGGEQALETLRARAWDRGIRLASDMVPNHTGLDSRWVVEHPERFLQLDSPPFSGYSFGGADVSSDGRVEVRIEDGYYDGSDAAVVYQVRDKVSGRVRYLYHGNDGTLMPWNDTAQLDYLRSDVRDAVVETILEVAGRFPIIRFDAAMTLVRRHIRRLWHPAPGEGGAIASRSRHAMAASAFESAMPREFWRDVVEAVAARAPDTLLLAEAFWLMESYFVRTLGMHRVYNSAFMHMLADEDNAGYRELVRETLAFDPRILERFVNYLTNPDEDSARERFGDGDKYFGATTVLATTPGLPMFGHGQVAGLREKYGMEFRAPRLSEPTDHGLVERHRREIAPLLRDRADFASSARFRLFTLRGDDGSERSQVIVYGFVAGEKGASLVAFNNSPQHVAGSIDRCEPFVGVPEAERSVGALGLPLLQALGLDGGGDSSVSAILHPDGQPVEWPVAELNGSGLSLALGPYEYRVYRDMHRATPAPVSYGAAVSDRIRPARTVRHAVRSSLLAGPYGSGARRAAARRRRG